MADDIKLAILSFLTNEWSKAEDIAAKSSMPLSTVASAISTLEADGLIDVKREEKTLAQLTEEGEFAAANGLPERILANSLGKGEEELSNVAVKTKLDRDKFTIALLWAKRNNWALVISSSGKTLLRKLNVEESKHEQLLSQLRQRGALELTTANQRDFKELAGRKLVKLMDQKVLWIKITKKGVDVAIKARKGGGAGVVGVVTQVTPQIVRSADISKTKFQPYNVEAEVAPLYGGKRHPLQILGDQMRDVLVGMGFEEMDGPLVESSFWNFDVMFMPQNHPNREMMDTFFLKQPNKAQVPKKLAEIEAQVHINGWKTGSKGCASAWSVEEAAKTILRTHTTATTFRYLERIGKGEIKTPCKFFSINKVFRNEAIDRTHLPEFHQIEGFVAADGMNLRNLMGVFKEFYSALGITKLRFKPVFNPYTEPSMEIFGYHDVLAKWVEIGNSGIFRPETLQPLGIKQNVNVIAWGLALERAAMILFGVDDIRKVMGSSTDLQWIRDFPEKPAILK